MAQTRDLLREIRRGRVRSGLFACAVIVAIASLGSPALVRRTDGLADPSLAADGAPSVLGISAEGEDAAARVSAARVTGRAGASAAATNAETAGATGTRDNPRPAATTLWKGVGEDSITIGITYITGTEVISQLGAGDGGEIGASGKDQAQAVIDYLNARDGIKGKRIIPVFHETNLARAAGGSDEATRACIAFTQDSTVFGAVTTGGINNQCMAENKTPVLSPHLGTSLQMYRDFPDYLYGPASIAAEREADIYVDGLVEQGFFAKLPAGYDELKIGVVSWEANRENDEPLFRAAFRRHGLKISEWGNAVPGGTRDQSIVLRFNQQDITHVIFPGYSPIFFMQAAQTQSYHPFYGLFSYHNMRYLQDNVPQEQLQGSRAVGYLPASDTDERYAPGWLGPNHKLCGTIMREAGLPGRVDSMGSAVIYCDGLFALAEALDRASELTPSGMREGYESIRSWDSSVTFKAGFAPDNHDGARSWRPVAFADGCDCYRYVGTAVPIPFR